jgi:hypothetical protein
VSYGHKLRFTFGNSNKAEQPEFHTQMGQVYDEILIRFSGMIAWSAITTGKGLLREDFPAIFARSKFNRKYSSFSWAEDEINGEVCIIYF